MPRAAAFSSRGRPLAPRPGTLRSGTPLGRSSRSEPRQVVAPWPLWILAGRVLGRGLRAQTPVGGGAPRHEKSRPISRVLSWTAIRLANASPRRSSDLPGSRAGRTWPLAQPASLFGLAPGGVCRAAECCHRRGALLPHHFTLAGARESALAVYFLLHFPWAHAPQVLPGTVPWEPGLSSARLRVPRLPGRLRGAR
jgi:hypothetical protein